MYQIITSEYQVISIYAASLVAAVDAAHDAGFKIISITELKDCDIEVINHA